MKKIVLTLIASLLCFFASAQISIQEARALWKEWDEVHATYARDYARFKSKKKLNFRLLSEPKRTYVLRLTNFIITTERIDADNLIFGQASEYLSKQADSWRDKINQATIYIFDNTLHPCLNNAFTEFGFQLVHQMRKFVVVRLYFLKQRLLHFAVGQIFERHAG